MENLKRIDVDSHKDLIKAALYRMKTIEAALQDNPIPTELKEHYAACTHSFNQMIQYAVAVIENCNRMGTAMYQYSRKECR